MNTASSVKTATKQQLILRYIEEKLRRERHAMERAVQKNLRGAAELEEGWDERDSPAEDEIRELEFCHRDALLRQLRTVDEALDRIRQKRFGICVSCGGRIAIKRLFNDLTVARCLDCQSNMERNFHAPTM